MKLLVLAAVAGTSLIGWAVVQRLHPGRRVSLREAAGALLEWIGVFAVFTAANVAVGVLTVFLIRGFTPWFVSLYGMQDLLLVLFSAAQAFLFTRLLRRS